ncbi:hypothetical protein ACQKLP_18665 [Chitinophaga sp. NPDC101104]|uniref:hypothetical protein n=1 Tax=Chitinophaga sp. NPDC101104 TaxID=3390561 RepID=UPI003CFCCCA4
MNYMKCQHCTEYSALKSEYLTFCDHCGKKFPVIYKDWLAHHPDGNLDAFGLENGISGEEFAALERRKERKAHFTLRKKATLAFGIVCFVAVLGLSFLYGPYLMAFFREPRVSPTLLQADQWRTFKGHLIRIQTPLSLRPESPDDRPNMRRKAFQAGGRAEGIMIRMEESVFLAQASVVLEEAAQRTAREMEIKPGVSRFSYTSRELQVDGQPALLQQGTYVLQETSPVAFQSLVFVKGGSQVQLLVTHSADDPAGKQTADKIMTSIHMN